MTADSPGYPGQSVTFETAAIETVTLFLGTEKGFTYRLSLAVTARDSAQILIRNPDAAAPGNEAVSGSDPHVSALTRLIRAAARREPLAGYAIEAAPPRGAIGRERRTHRNNRTHRDLARAAFHGGGRRGRRGRSRGLSPGCGRTGFAVLPRRRGRLVVGAGERPVRRAARGGGP